MWGVEEKILRGLEIRINRDEACQAIERKSFKISSSRSPYNTAGPEPRVKDRSCVLWRRRL
jgi:hypothetical protein